MVGSVTGGLVRVDIPIPAIVDYNPEWNTPNFQIDINAGSIHHRLEAILQGIIAERLPLPTISRPHRLLTELYPINEAERLLKSRLRSHEELRLLF